MSGKRVIIIGGGFGGAQCAKTLSRELAPAEAEVVLFNRENHLVFSPLLAEVVGSSINTLDVVVPLRQLLPRVLCRTEEVRAMDLGRNEIAYEAEDGGTAPMSYDHLVIACGNVANLNVVPGMADHAFPLKTVADAAALRSHIIERMEKAEVTADSERRRWHLSFVVVGGGYSGVEAAGEINDLVRGSARYFRNWRAEEATVTLIHSRDQVLPEISPPLREFARRKMERAGVQVVLSARVISATPEGVGLQDGRSLRGGTIVCTVGSSIAPVVASLNAPKEKGRLRTESDLRLCGASNVWVVGDCGFIVNTHDGCPSPTTGQFAERQGRQCARNIARSLRKQPAQAFRFKQLGELCSIGGRSAVADLFGVHLSGFLAWFVWRGVYLFKLPSWGRRCQVGFDWAWLLLFPRDLAHTRAQQTDRVTHAHYESGDFIFRRGEPPTHFYVLEQGEVEVVRSQNGEEGEVIAVLGAGSFFGEKALLNQRPRVMSVRARTPVEVLVLGKNVFTQISSALAPLRDALAQALNRRGVDAWKGQPEAHELLERTPVRDLVQPAPRPLLHPATPLREAGRAFVEHGHEFFYVSSDGVNLDGVVTITDLVRARSGTATGDSPVSDFMTRNPIVVSSADTCAVAAAAFREYRLKNLPVVEQKNGRKLAGYIGARRIMGFVLKELARQKEGTPAR